jgi:formylglycine-generating enzyme required for sulfatase activity
VVVRPEADRVSVRGGLLRIDLGDRFLLRPGEYTVVAEKAGYHGLEQTLVVRNVDSETFEFTLERLPGFLFLTTGEVTGARVMIDGEEVGLSPVSGVEVREGRHELRVTAERYLPWSDDVTLEGGGVERHLEVELLPAWANVSLGSDPPGAVLYLDGDEVGPAPLTIAVGAGSRQLELRLSGRKTWKKTLFVEANQPQSLGIVSLGPADGQVRLRIVPERVSVTVDGEFQGYTPMDLSVSSGESHRFRLSKVGHESATRTLTLEPDEERTLSVKLKPLRGELVVATRPRGARLFVDGEPRGSANQKLMLSAVPHVVEVRKDGYETFRTHVTPRPGFPQGVRVRLLSLEEARTAGLAPRIVTSQGQELLLVTGGKFATGAARREQGRRANEVVRSVELDRPFYFATGEVTNAEYREFDRTHSSGFFGRFSLDADAHPVVNLSWEQAARYCNWLSRKESLEPVYIEGRGGIEAVDPLSNGYRLPTEAEWVWVARYDAGQGEHKYPWGRKLPVRPGSGNFADASARKDLDRVMDAYDDGYPVSAPVGSFPASAFGAHDLGGNVAEWIHDYYEIGSGTSQEPLIDPAGPAHGERHVIRGSSWQDATITELRFSYRDYGSRVRPDLGFRVARYAR